MSIEIKNVYKKYGKVEALNDVNLTLDNHKIYGLLGRYRRGWRKYWLCNCITCVWMSFDLMLLRRMYIMDILDRCHHHGHYHDQQEVRRQGICDCRHHNRQRGSCPEYYHDCCDVIRRDS